MGGAAKPDDREARHRRSRRRDSQRSAERHLPTADAVNDGSVGAAPIVVVMAWGRPDLRVGMIGSTAIAAEPAASVEDCAVWEEKACGVVGSRDGEGRHLGEGLGGWVPELGDQLRGLVCESDGVVLAACDEDLAVRHDDAVMEGAGEGHGVYGFDWGVGVGLAEGDYVGVGCRVGV